MSRVLVIGCGGVANVAIRKCCQVSEVFTELCIASRTKSKCDKLAAELEGCKPAESFLKCCGEIRIRTENFTSLYAIFKELSCNAH